MQAGLGQNPARQAALKGGCALRPRASSAWNSFRYEAFLAARVGAKSVSEQPVGSDVMHSMQNLATDRFRVLHLGQIRAMSTTDPVDGRGTLGLSEGDRSSH